MQARGFRVMVPIGPVFGGSTAIVGPSNRWEWLSQGPCQLVPFLRAFVLLQRRTNQPLHRVKSSDGGHERDVPRGACLAACLPVVDL